MTTLSRASTLTPCNSPVPPDIPVQPDHFYGSHNVQLPLSPQSDGRTWLDPADDPLAQRGIPVFKPTMEEFQDFEGYMDKVECWGNRSGIVKVIPPKQWTDALPSIKDQLAEVKIKSPIEQLMFGDRGLFRQQNMEKRKWMSVREWVELCSKEDFKAPSIREVGLASRTAPAIPRPRIQRRGKRKADSAVSEASPALEEARVKEEPEPQTPSEELPVEPQTPPISEGSTVSRKAGSRKQTKQEVKDEAKPRPKRVHPSREAREASLADRAARDRAFIDVFDPQAAWLPADTNPGDYTPEFCQQLERRFWRGLGFGGKPAWYGADTQGSLFTDATTSWNVAHLPSALSRLLPSSRGLPGVNTPYLYFGMWRATFAWHVEDMDLFSINYIHFGAPKFWYAIPQGRATGLEQAMRSYFPKDTSQCSQFLRHKSFLASPSVLAKDACKPNYLVQHAGEFVITFPRGYHAGFNLGLNCAESVNFALESWIDLGRKAKACGCVNDSVRIDVDQLLREREEERLDPATNVLQEFSTKGLAGVDSQDDALSPPLKPSSRKRKLDGDVSARGKKKLKVSDPKSGPASSAVSSAKGQPKITLKLGPRSEEQESFPCCLCVSISSEGLLRVQNPPFARKDAAEAAGHPKVWLAHEFCANVVPETWVDNFIRSDGNAEKVVYGVDGIVKDRWNLKCSACTKTRPKMHGAPVQCTKGKCAKAFHVNCAKDGHAQGVLLGVLREVDKEVISLNNVPVSAVPCPPTPGTDGKHMSLDVIKTMQQHDSSSESVFKVVKKLEVQILCTQHNPAVAAQKKANKQDKIRNELMALPSMSRIKIRVSAGVFEVSLIRVIEETGSVEVLWDQNIKKEFKWGSVVLGNTDTPIQHRPSETVDPSKRDVPSAVLVTTHLSTPATLSQPKIEFQAGGSSSRTNNQSSTQTTVSMGLKPQLFVSGNRVMYPASFNYGQWPGHHVGATPYGISAVQNSLPFPYSAYYGVPTNSMVAGSESQQNHGQQQSYNGSTVVSATQTQGSNPTDQAMSSTTADQSSNASSSQSNTSQGMQAFQPLAPSNGQNLVWDAPTEDSTMTSNQSPESSTIDPSTLSLEPAQLAEILRANPGLASVVLAALGQTQSRV